MKNINFKIYVLSFLFFFWWVFSYYMTKWHHEYFATIFIWFALTIWLINTSSILFYKTLNSNDDYLKYVFSFLHILVLLFISFLIL